MIALSLYKNTQRKGEMIMKKTLVTASIISAALFLSACGETTEMPVDSSAEETTTPAETEETTTEQATEETKEETTTEPAKEEAVPTQPVEEPAVETVEPPVKETVQPDESSQYTMGQNNAIRQAKDYLNFTAFSRQGLIEQLEFEGYSTEDATFAVDHIEVDWMEQAAKTAQNYLDFSSFSKQGLIDQLEFEGFTSDQAAYGVSAVGY